MQLAEPIASAFSDTVVPDAPPFLAAVERRPAGRAAFTDLGTGRCTTYGDLRGAARRAVALMRRFGIRRGDVVATLEAGPDLLPKLLACSALGARLLPVDGTLPRAQVSAVLTRSEPRVVVAPEAAQAGVPRGRGETLVLTPEEWEQATADLDASSDACRAGRAELAAEPCLIVHTAGTTGLPKPVLITPANLVQMARAFRHAYPITGKDTLFAASSLATAGGIVASGVVPMLVGIRVVLAPSRALLTADAYWDSVEQAEASVCELPAWRLRALLGDDDARRLPPRRLRFVLCSGGPLPAGERRSAETRWGRRVYQGYGTAETGYLTASVPYGGAGAESGILRASAGAEIAIRPLRTPPVRLRSKAADGAEERCHDTGPTLGEIVVRGASVTPGYHRKGNLTHVAFEDGWFRTGDLGWLDGDGGLSVVGRCRDVAVRGAAAVLVSDVDALLARHRAVAESRTVICPAGGRGRVVSVCVADASAEELRSWLAARVDPPWLADQVLLAGALPRGLGGEVSTELVEAVADGRLAGAVLDALTARRFRRNPPHREDGLRALVQDALLGNAPLEFLMFWGCGPRDGAAEPDHAALAALGELLDTPRLASTVRTHVRIIFTDAHATANGHSERHRLSYFSSVRRAAGNLPASFHLESEVWAAHGLTVEQVRRYAGTAELQAAWDGFPLRDRFVEQAGRHSRNGDREAAARHYFATCKLERDVLLRAFPRSVFLTYNGPEFNDCFPDLPTLYIYPGPRGRTVKPWFT